MSEIEALKILKRDLAIQIENKALPDGINAITTAIQALEEIQQYRAIGTVEQLQNMKEDYKEAVSDWRQYRKIGTVDEFKALKEKSVPKKPRWHGHYFCPHCNNIVYVNGGKNIYCPCCGQALDWQ